MFRRILLFICLYLTLQIAKGQSNSFYRIELFTDSIQTDGNEYRDILTHQNAINPIENSFLPVFELVLNNVRISSFSIDDISYLSLTSNERNIVRNDTVISVSQPRKIEEETDGSIVTRIQIPTVEYDSDNNRFRKVRSFQLSYDIAERVNAGSSASVLSQGRWFKITVTDEDIYRINASFLSSMGVNVSEIDPRTIQIFGNGGKMLPQRNDAKRPVGLIENAIAVSGEEDGRFDNNDFIIFYGQSSDSVGYDRENFRFYHQNNLYSDTTFYFLTFGQNLGKRVSSIDNVSGTFPILDAYTDFDYFENDSTTILVPGSGREWYGVRLTRNRSDRSITFVKPGIVGGSSLRINSKVVGQTFATAEMLLSVNGSEVGSQSISPVPDTRYGIKASQSESEFLLQADGSLSQDGRIRLDYEFVANTTVQTSIAHVDYVTLESRRTIGYYDQPSFFQFFSEELDGSYTLNVQGNSQLKIWNISDKYNPQNQNFTVTTGGDLQFSGELNQNSSFVVFDQTDLSLPVSGNEIPNQNLAQSSPSDLLIVTAPFLKNEAERYAAFKESSGTGTSVVTVNEIYNEFSSGSQDITAIRDFVRSQFEKSTSTDGLKYVMLFGKGSYDYKDRVPNNTNLVPIYESRNSFDPINSYSSDDYFGFMDPSEGEWIENSRGDHLLDLGVGRIPVVNLVEARAVIDKLIHYKTDPDRFGQWTNDVVFIADDEDNNLHQGDAEELWQMIDTVHSEFLSNKIYVDAFEQEVTPVERAPAVTEAILEAIDEGALMVNFTGHGGEIGWTDEQIFQIPNITSLNNFQRLPLFITATCEFGRNDDPLRVSGGELLVTNGNGGAIALITTSRPVFSNSNFELNRALLNVIFDQDDQGVYPTLGDIIMDTKNNSLSGPNNRNFSLLGDPSMILNYPEYGVQSLELKNQISSNNIDTVSALSRISLSGHIVNGLNTVMEDFNGTVNIRVFDKLNDLETLGSKITSRPFPYQLRDNVIFNGQASVVNGEFSTELIIPINIDYSFGEGLIHFYAESDEFDANGALNEIIIGGSETNAPLDEDPPEILAFLNDSTFTNGDLVGPSPLLIMRLSDESGINISNEGFSNGIEVNLDGRDPILLNELFISDLDDFTTGWVFFKLEDLEKGDHTLRISTSDNYGNRSSEELNFVVGESEGIRLGNLEVYPNPVRSNGKISFSFFHNGFDESAIINMEIMTIDGQVVYNFSDAVFLSGNSEKIEVNLIDAVNSSQALNENIFIYRLSILSQEDGSSDTHAGRLILDN